MLDFDLNRAVLHSLFDSEDETIGNMELLHILNSADLSRLTDSLIDVSGFVNQNLERSALDAGSLKYIPTIADPVMLDQIKLNHALQFFVQSMFKDIHDNCSIEILLVNVEPGWSSPAGLILPLADHIVIVTRLDNQNIVGLSRMTPVMRRKKIDPILVCNFLPRDVLLRKRSEARMAELKEATGIPSHVEFYSDEQLMLGDVFAGITDPKSTFFLGMRELVGKLNLIHPKSAKFDHETKVEREGKTIDSRSLSDQKSKYKQNLMSTQPEKVFICYRREDSRDIAGRIYDYLVGEFGADKIFQDITIPAGNDFKQYVLDTLGRCSVLLVLIGDRWLKAKEQDGRRRIDDLDDLVRLEIKTALKRRMRVIPVLVGESSLPKDKELPDDLKPLAFRQALRVQSDADFRIHMDRLVRTLDTVGRMS